MEAADAGQIECLKLLLEKGANVNHTKDSGQTALMKAASWGRTECAKLLLEKGADANMKATGGGFEGQGALEIAKEQQDYYAQQGEGGKEQAAKFEEFVTLLREHMS